jgi:signal transduction histidine kinase
MFKTLAARLMLAFAVFTFGLSAWYGLLVLAAAYNVEDKFFDAALQKEAQALKTQRTQTGAWPTPQTPWMSLHETAQSLPPDSREVIARETHRTEYVGSQGRHYHVLPLLPGQRFPLLLAEVSQQLVVRPVRNEILAWLAAWSVGTCLAALLLAAWLARRLSQPMHALTQAVAQLDPAQMALHAAGTPPHWPGLQRTDELGTLARAFAALANKTQAFVAREHHFTRDASHELRTPLAVMQLSLESPVQAPGQQRALHTQVTHMKSTVDMLLLLSREDLGTHIGVRTPVLPIAETWAMTHEAWLAERGVRLEFNVGPELTWPMPEDAARCVLFNLLSNAVQHGPQGGCISMSVHQARLQISNAAPAQAQPKSPSPSGVGLSIVARVLERFGGKYELQVSPQAFRVELFFGRT